MPERHRDTLLILGAGGHGKVVADTAVGAGWRDVRFLDDRLAPGTRVGSWVVHGPFPDALRAGSGAACAVAVGANALRLEWVERLIGAGIECPAIVSPHAVVSALAEIGDGTVVVAGAIVAVHARIGRACILNTGCSVDHDCVVGDGVHVSPGARLGGGVQVGPRSWIGIGATVRHDIGIGCDSTIGAGAVVIRHVADGSTVIGVAAQPMRGADDSSGAAAVRHPR